MWQYADFDQYRLFNDQQVPDIYKRSFHDLTTEVKSPFQCVSIRISACIRLLKYSCVSRHFVMIPGRLQKEFCLTCIEV